MRLWQLEAPSGLLGLTRVSPRHSVLQDGFSRRETGSATVRALKEALTGSAGVDSAPPCGRDGGPVVGREHLS